MFVYFSEDKTWINLQHVIQIEETDHDESGTPTRIVLTKSDGNSYITYDKNVIENLINWISGYGKPQRPTI